MAIKSLTFDGLTIIVDISRAEIIIVWAVGSSNDASHLMGPNATVVGYFSLILLLSNCTAAIDIVRQWIKGLSVVMLPLNQGNLNPPIL